MSVVLPRSARTELIEAVTELGIPVCRTLSVRKRDAIGEAICEFVEESFAVVSVWYGLEFVPPDLLERVYEHHQAAGNSFTPVDGLPYPFVPELYRRDVLRDIGGVDLPGLPSDPMEFLRAMYRAQRAANDSTVNTLVCTPFAASSVYGLIPNWMPRRFETSMPDEVGRVLDAARETEGLNWTQRLSALRALTVADAERRVAIHSVRRRRSSRPLRVLYVSSGSGYSGAESCLVSLIGALDRTRIDPHAVIPLEGWFANQLRRAGTRVICVNRDFGTPRVDNVVFLDRLLGEIAPDILHLNGPCGLPILTVSRVQKIRTVFHMRVAELPGGAECLACADRIISVSRFVAEQLASELCNTNKISVIYDGVDCRMFHPDAIPMSAARERFGLNAGDFVVLCAARFSEGKRHDVVLRAFRRLVQRVPSARLLLVGEPSTSCDIHSRCERTVAKWGLEREVLFAGFQADVRWATAAGDAVVVCAEREALGTIALEAMAMGKPVVVAASGGLPEIIVSGDSGLAVPAGDPESTAEALVTLAGDSGYRRRIGQAARLRVESRFSIELSAAGVCELYDALMAQTVGLDPAVYNTPASYAALGKR